MTASRPSAAAALDGRTYGIDLLRGVACLAVVAFHYLSRGPRAGFMPVSALPSLEPFARYGYLGVHLFFMVSGYVIFLSASGQSPRAFVASRAARLYPALWIAATVTMACVVIRHDARFLVSWSEYLWNLTLIPQFVGARFVDGAYWSLAVEFQFYLLVWIMLRTGLLAKAESGLWLWLGVAVIDGLRPTYLLERWLIANWAPLFIFGAATYLVASRGRTWSRVALMSVALGAAVWHSRIEVVRLGQIWSGEGPDARIAGAIIVASAVPFVLYGVGTLRMNRSALAIVSGRLTYPVYLIHQVCGYLLYGILVQQNVAPVVALVVTTGAALLSAWMINVAVERPLGPRLRRALAGAHARRASGGETISPLPSRRSDGV